MNLNSCILFIVVFYPVTFFACYYTRCNAVLVITTISLILGSLMTYGFYHDVEFWRGWIHSWHRSAQLGFGHSALFSCLFYWIAAMGDLIKVKKKDTVKKVVRKE